MGQDQDHSSPSDSTLQYRRNPIALAQSWQKWLATGEIASRAELARQLGFSRAHVTQVLSLLHLAPEVQETIVGLGDPIKEKWIGIHTLRSLLRFPAEQQVSCINKASVGEA